MTRPRKQTVDWFPHSCNHGKTMFILERRWGIAGYGFWFKLLEILGNTEGHFVDADNSSTLDYLQAYTYTNKDTCIEILEQIASLEAIDPKLWEERIIWSDNFVKGLAPCYRKREAEIPLRPDNNRQKSAEEEKEIKIKIKNPPPSTQPPSLPQKPFPLPPDFCISVRVKSWAEKKKFTHLEEHLEAFLLRAQAKGYKYLDWDAAFMNAIRENWGQIDLSKPEPPKDPDPNCPICRGTGRDFYEENGEKLVRDCQCLRRADG